MSVAVVGSINLDLVFAVNHHVAPGETVLASSLTRHSGGKGANQAVAAQRLGQPTALVGCVGDDDAGRFLLAELRREGLDLRHVSMSSGSSGLAVVAVDSQGENAIIVSAGANAELSAEHVTAAADVLADADVTLLQLEVSLASATAAARQAGGRVVLNPAPAQRLPVDLLQHVDVLVPNRGELAALADMPIAGTADVVRAAARLDVIGALVVTLGADGVIVVEAGRPVHLPARPVAVRDTTGAGDAFCGALADALARGHPLVDAAEWANRAAALATTRPGAQSSFPRREELLPAPTGRVPGRS